VRTISLILLLLLATFIFSCSTACEECSDDFTLRFQIRNEEGVEVITDPGSISVRDLQENEFDVSRDGTESDTSMLVQMSSLVPEDIPDTVLIFVNNGFLDSAFVDFGFQRDNECCQNPRIVESFNTLNLKTDKIVRRNFNIYSITAE